MEVYQTPEAMKKVWAVELDLLDVFKQICAKHGLRYFATGGTLLGAARHKGFIPWDDDIDVMMPWSDCKTLLEVAPKELIYPYFLQSHLSEKNGEISNFRLRRSDTTGCTKWEYENVSDPSYNRGIFIDIFPMFYVPTDPDVKARQKELIMETWKAFRGYTSLKGKEVGLRNVNPEYEQYIDIYLEYRKHYSIQQIKELYFERCAMQKEPTEEVGVTAFRVHDPANVWKTKWFAESVELEFENTTVMAPKSYIEWLDHRYGDWHTPVYNGAMHEMYVYDAETPYTEKLQMICGMHEE